MDFREVMGEAIPDMEATLRRFAGKQQLLEKFVLRFCEDGTFGKLEQAVAAGDRGAMETTAHTLKGVSGNMGFQRLFESCTRMVDDLRGDRMDRVDGDWREVRQEYQRVVRIIRRWQGDGQ